MDGQNLNREIAFSQPVINIGADSGNDIVLRGNSIADFHVMLDYDSTHWHVTILDKDKNTTLNGRPVENGAQLQNGSVLGIGGYRLTMNLNGINTDFVIKSQNADSIAQTTANDSTGQNILLEVTGQDQTEIDAGASAEFQLTVTNAGPLVANMQLQVQSVPTAWIQIIPPVVNLNEGRKGQFTVRVSPPRDSSAEAGHYALHFVAISPNYQGETGTADSTLTVLPYSEFLLHGPTPRTISLKRTKSSDLTDVVIINNSNAASDFFMHSYDDSNELYFSYEYGNNANQGQETVRVRPGDNARVPTRISAKKLPLFGFVNHTYHYYTNVTPSDRPGDQQSVIGEVIVRPLINTFWLLLFLALMAVAGLFILQPRIHYFEGSDGKKTQVILYGNSTRLDWNVSPFAGTIKLDSGSGAQDVSRRGSQYVTPTVSTTYTLTSENFFSRLLNIQHRQTVQVLIIPQRPTINAFSTDLTDAYYNQQVTLTWSVGENAKSASVVYNKQNTDLTPEKYSSTLSQGYTTDTLFSVKAENDSGYEMKSLFLNVSPDRIDLNRFIVWVRPNGIAVPNDNDTRRTSRWSALDLSNLTNTTDSTTLRPAVNPMPAPQSNTLNIPDNYNDPNVQTQGLNPEQMMLLGQNTAQSGYIYTPQPQETPDNLLIGPALLPTATPTPVEEIEQIGRLTVTETAVPQTSPEGAPYNRDFSIKLAEVVEDPLAESGYRVIDYFPDYQLQKGEQILVEWNVNGVSKVKIDNLSSDDLNNTGGNFASPEKTTTYVLKAQVGNLNKEYSLPVRVAGDADNGEGSGLNCDLKANATTLTVPGTVMLTWSGGGNSRVQLISSAKAESENEDAIKEAEEKARAAGQSYTRPTNQPLTGGIIGDYLQPSGFMRVNVDKQTTFMLNAYDNNNNVICTKSVQVNYSGGNDKLNLKLAISRIANSDNVVQSAYTVGQTIQYTVALSGYEKGKEPSGSVVITDGTTSCSVTLPVTTCSFQAKKTGTLTITAVYSGDNTYNKATATAKETVIDKYPTTTSILRAVKPETTLADLIVQLGYNKNNSLGVMPIGTITITVGSGTCELDIVQDKLTCDGKAVEDESDPYKFTISKMLLKDSTADRVTASYGGDNYFAASTSTSVLFMKYPTTTTISKDPSPYKHNTNLADLTSILAWTADTYGLTPTGTIKFTTHKNGSDAVTGTCVLNITTKTLTCDGSKSVTVNADSKTLTAVLKNMLLADKDADRIKAEYSGDSAFNASESTIVLFNTTPKIVTTIKIDDDAYKPEAGLATLTGAMTWDKDAANGAVPTGTLTFIPSNKGTDIGKCVYDLKAETFSCEVDGENSSVKLNAEKDGFDIDISQMLMSDPAGDRIRIEYSGDNEFAASSSTIKLFKTIPTTTTIKSAVLTDESLINMTVVILPDEMAPDKKQVYGEIILRSGYGGTNQSHDSDNPTNSYSAEACHFNIDTGLFEFCTGKATVKSDEKNKNELTITITDLRMNGTPRNEITAEYNGDSVFLASESESFPFGSLHKVDTELIISSAYKPEAGLATLTGAMTWDKDATNGAVPTGTLTFIPSNKGTDIGKCIYDLDAETFSCEVDGENSSVILNDDKEPDAFNIVVTQMLMSDPAVDRIRIEYSGDNEFASSASTIKLFTTIPTKTTIESAHLTSNNLVQIKVRIRPDEIAPGVKDKNITGKITFRSGAESSSGSHGSDSVSAGYSSEACTFNITKRAFEYCYGTAPELQYDSKDNDALILEFSDLRMNGTPKDNIVVEYFGDSVFLASYSASCSFSDTYKVTLTADTTAIYSDGRLYLNTVNTEDQKYPLYPDEPLHKNPVSACSNNVATCHELKHEFPLKVLIELDSTSATMSSSDKLTFGGDVTGTCTPEYVSDGKYSCTLNTSFTTTGLKIVTVKFDGNNSEKLAAASTVFPEMYAVAVPSSGIETSTLLTLSNSTPSVGEKVTVTANTTQNRTDISGASWLFYTYNEKDNSRIETCYGTSCELEITADTKKVVAEYMGSENPAYLPSMEQQRITINSNGTSGTQSTSSVPLISVGDFVMNP